MNSICIRITIFALIIPAICTTGCATQGISRKPMVDPGVISDLRGSNSDVEMRVGGVESASDGWLEYRVEITNRRPHEIGGFRGIVIDNSGAELAAASMLSDVEKPPEYVKTAVVYAGVSAGAMMIAVPFLAPIAVGSMVYMRSKRMQSAHALNTRFHKESLEGRSMAGRETIRGSFYLPAVEPVAIRFGYVEGGTRRWLTIGGSDGSRSVGGSNRQFTASESIAPMSIAEAQRRLTALGYNVGTVDGQFGPKTEKAISAFQRDRKLKVTGTLDAATVEKL